MYDYRESFLLASWVLHPFFLPSFLLIYSEPSSVDLRGRLSQIFRSQVQISLEVYFSSLSSSSFNINNPSLSHFFSFQNISGVALLWHVASRSTSALRSKKVLSHMWLFKLLKIQNSLSQSHHPHLKMPSNHVWLWLPNWTARKFYFVALF